MSATGVWRIASARSKCKAEGMQMVLVKEVGMHCGKECMATQKAHVKKRHAWWIQRRESKLAISSG